MDNCALETVRTGTNRSFWREGRLVGVVWAWPRISVWPVVVITLLCVVMEKCLRADARNTADWVWGKTQRNRTFRRKWRVSKGLKR